MSDWESSSQVQIGSRLSKLERTRVKGSRACSAERRIIAVGDVEIEPVVTVNAAQIVGPAFALALDAECSGIVADSAVDQRKESVRIDRADRVVVARHTPIARALTLTVADATERVDLRPVGKGGERAVAEERDVIRVGVTLPEVQLAVCRNNRVSGITSEILGPFVQQRPIGRTAILVLPGNVKESVS